MVINGVYVENLRKKLGLSQDDFANLLGVSRGTVKDNNFLLIFF